jgi:1,2-dihydroxy-3-keto-5-methylthiopentene dioxygenase
MTHLTVWRDDSPASITLRTDAPSKIADVLDGLGVRFEQWSLRRSLPSAADQNAVLAAYAAEIDGLKRTGGYAAADVVRLPKGTPNTEAMRAKFLDEHVHSEDEVRFFVEGTGAFYLRSGEKVHQIVCTAGDLLTVPANTRHWFDMGDQPHFTAIRLFTDPTGWVANYTGDGIARRFPLFGAPS